MSEAFPMEMLGELVAVRPDDADSDTSSGVKLPAWQRSLHGVVIATGPGRPLPDGSAVPMTTKVGDRVTFGAAVGVESSFNGKLLRIMRDSEIDMVLE